MRKTLTGLVTSDKRNKTVRVQVERRYRHPRYGKIVRGRTVCHVLVGVNGDHEGVMVEIMGSGALAKTKLWQLLGGVKAKVEVLRFARAGSALRIPPGEDSSN